MPSIERLTAELARATAEIQKAQQLSERLRVELRQAGEKNKQQRDIFREQVRALLESLE